MASSPPSLVPRIQSGIRADGLREVELSGNWTLVAMSASIKALAADLAAQGKNGNVAWSLLNVDTIDSTGAMLLWRAWGHALPASLQASPEQLSIFSRIEALDLAPLRREPAGTPLDAVAAIGGKALNLGTHLHGYVRLIGLLWFDVLHLARRPSDIPWREISANMFKSGVRAMPVTALVGFLIGVVMSYLSALQLKQLGAEVFIVNIIGMGVIRELGPVLVAVLVAGRSGSAMTAQLGVMRVTEEIDALAVMGVSRSLRLIFPKVFSLSIAMPLLVLWASAIALIGGMVSAQLQLDISYGFFFETLPKVVPVSNLWIGLAKGFTFGIMVALVACHFGLRVQPNTESLSANTTASVVTAITVVILVDAIIAIATRSIGLY